MGLDPVVLFFLFGLFAGLVKSELKLPPALYDTLSILLLLAIGLHGGVELAEQASAALLGQSALVLLLGCCLPLLAFPMLRALGFSRVDSASVAAHYGSVSAGTFAVVVAFLLAKNIAFESYMPLFVAILEIPAILVGIVLAKGISRDTNWRELGREIFLGKSIMLLLGGLIIGAIAGKEGIKPLEPFYTSMFKPVLALFLLEMGLIASGQLGSLKRYGLRLAAFGLGMPLLGALIGAVLARLMGLSLGGTAMLATLAASASYIAVPAALRLALPEANPSLSLTASLGITFPFNILIGIPLYLALAEQLIAWGF
ncbi:sodium-dependent bicarbonate transport family permease [Stutzerimonas nosocomialis]|uniref:Sodium-dependent bicarbonate transport family permease n=1 Tax=Stutzerimonas nosocomialis TaxID=1056496 RepID=A0A5R9Q9T0_9GAMM|nr:sodium-dependent bicarbonate transport family permease [Stutzerimonas nosocomialis]TLX54764.1 sodium-dependent bicarbonate transport family permease [Stutzerimonas nosocomialis]TLX61171.1 sodium-dependent bicarbonate transport family permease [Stutzerimonas nosocomialis]TLX61879.1 sodium-dependent bicarbonate transport family permease [Stutzerimonas nosocomialis]